MINPIESAKLSKDIADQLRVRLGYHSVTLSYEDQTTFGNNLALLLSNYESTALMSGDQDAVKETGSS